jgi:AcrR family transcriptional regulator
MSLTPPPDRQPEATRQRLLQAALQLFGQVGYAQATTRRIADAAGVNEVTLFRHFGSKKDLLAACIAAHNAAGFSGTFNVGLSGDYPADILTMARRQTADTRRSQEVLRMLLCDARSVPELRQALLAGGRENFSRLSAYFQEQIDAGTVRPDLPAAALATAFDSLFSSSVLFEHLFAEDLAPQLPVDELITPLVALFVRGTQRTD